MARLIDAVELKKQKTVLWDEALGFSDCVLVEDIDAAPTVDAVEVVRCKDCKHWRFSGNNIFGPNYGTCVECLMDTQKDHFCSYGERKDNEN